MGWTEELDALIETDLTEFKRGLKKNIASDSNYLNKLYWMPDGQQLSVLMYLLHRHNPPQNDLLQHILCVLEETQKPNLGAPLHYALRQGKYALVRNILLIHAMNKENRYFDLDIRDEYGITLLALLITHNDLELFRAFLQCKPNLEEFILIQEQQIAFQPVHQALMKDNAEFVDLLLKEGASSTNAAGALGDTPLHMAARHQKMFVFSLLLSKNLNINVENQDVYQDEEGRQAGDKCIDLFCYQLDEHKTRANAIKGIGMLLCHQTLSPRTEALYSKMLSYHERIIAEIDRYLHEHPALINNFLKEISKRESFSANFLYYIDPVESGFRRIFGKPYPIAAKIISWAAIAAEPLDAEIKKVTTFMRNYDQAYHNKNFKNPWSPMLWEMANHMPTCTEIKDYVQNNPKSRSASVHQEWDGSENTHADDSSPTITTL